MFLSSRSAHPLIQWMDTMLFAVAASADLILTGTLVFILRNSYTRFER